MISHSLSLLGEVLPFETFDRPIISMKIKEKEKLNQEKQNHFSCDKQTLPFSKTWRVLPVCEIGYKKF
jgi:hypothetical protein